MSHISNRGEQSTSAEITALTNLAALAAAATGEFIKKTGATTFSNVSAATVVGPYTIVASSTAPTAVRSSADYVCDGTADDVQIQAALDAQATTGGKVYLTEGTFNIAATIVIDKDYLTLEGAGWGTILKAATNLNAYIIQFNNATYIDSSMFRNFKIDGNKSNQSSGGGMNARGATISIFDKLWFYSCKQISLNFDARADTAFGSNNCVTNCQFSTGGEEGVHITGNDENKVTGCVFSDFSNYGVYDNGGSNIIDNNVFVNGGTHIQIQDCSNTIVSNNFSDSAGQYGVKIVASNCTVTGNEIHLPGSSAANTYTGIYLSFGSYNTVTNNFIKSHGTAGKTKAFIEETNTQSYNNITDNTFSVNGSLGTSTVVFSGANSHYFNNLGYDVHTIPGALSITGSTAGSVVAVNVVNTATSGASYAQFYAEVNASSTGDAYAQFSVDAVSDWSIGIDNSDSDKFKVSNDATLGTNDRLVFNSSGTLTLPNATDTLVAKATTDTLTNKRITARVSTTASSATPTPNGDTDDEYTVTAQSAAAAFGAPSGTPTEGQKLIIRVKDNGTARALTWNAIYRAGTDVPLPTTTVISKTIYAGFIYNSTDTKWDLVAKAEGF